MSLLRRLDVIIGVRWFLLYILLLWPVRGDPQPLLGRDSTHSVGQCFLLVKGRVYIKGKCIVGEHENSDLTLYKDGYGAIVEFQGLEATGYWTGPFRESHAHDALGSLVRDGDCWINEDVKLCAYGRVHTSIGKCRLEVAGRTYVSGDCPIEIYKPFGSFYLNEGCHPISDYTASVIMEGPSSAKGAWSGDPPTAGAALALGELSRKGACWVNDVAKICAFKGRPDETKDCHETIGPVPKGYDESDLRTDFFEPDGRCLLKISGQTYISGKCSVETRADAFVISGAAQAAGYQAQIRASQDGFDGAWNGSFGEPSLREQLGKLSKVGNCWENKTADICVISSTPILRCNNNKCAWRLPSRSSKDRQQIPE